MKKLIMIMLAATAFSCGDGSNNRSSEGTNDSYDNSQTAEPDSTQSDTTSTGDMERRQNDGDMDRDESGTQQQDTVR